LGCLFLSSFQGHLREDLRNLYYKYIPYEIRNAFIKNDPLGDTSFDGMRFKLNAYYAKNAEEINFHSPIVSKQIETKLQKSASLNKVVYADKIDKNIIWVTHQGYIYKANPNNLKDFSFSYIGDILPNFDVSNSNSGIRGAISINNSNLAIYHVSKYDSNPSEKYAIRLTLIDFSNKKRHDSVLIDTSDVANQLGGGMDYDKDKNLIHLTTGDASLMNDFERSLKAQKNEKLFGKHIVFYLDNNKEKILKKTVLAKGLRNAQNMFLHKNNVFEVEHGPQGGDEINILSEGNNYGWPLCSYGSNYGGDNGSHLNCKSTFVEPIFHFTPSIGISDIDECPSNLLRDGYQPCIIVSAMKDKSFRLIKFNKEFNNVISVERVDVGNRVREILIDEKILYLFTDSEKFYKFEYEFHKVDK